MRTINLDDYATVEVWPGRRLYCTSPDDLPSLFQLPRSTMTGLQGKERDQLHFGTLARTTVLVTGSHKKARVLMLADALVSAERPDEEKVVAL